MHTGKGMLILRNGTELHLDYRFGGVFDDARAGSLICDTSAIDPGALLGPLQLRCDDGTEIVVAVMHSNSRHLGVIGRVNVRAPGSPPATPATYPVATRISTIPVDILCDNISLRAS